MRKHLVYLLISIVMISSLILPSTAITAYKARYTAEADKLNQLGLFKGTGSGYDLERAPTRIEALIMLIRLMGKEKEALSTSSMHPFTDVPAWADKYVAYAYNTGLAKGTSPTTFGATDANAAQFLTFVLRALGYDDSNGDFVWNSAAKKAAEIDLIDKDAYTDSKAAFYRDDCAKISFDALSIDLKSTGKTLADSLIAAGVIDKAAAADIAAKPASTDKDTAAVTQNSGDSVMIPIENRNGTYYASYTTLKKYVKNAECFCLYSYVGNNNFNDNFDNHVIDSLYLQDIIASANAEIKDKSKYKADRRLLSGGENYGYNAVVFDENDHVIACGWGKYVKKSDNKYYYTLTLCDYDARKLVSQVISQFDAQFNSAQKLSLSDFYREKTVKEGETETSSNTRIVLKVDKSKLIKNADNIRYIDTAGNDTGQDEKRIILGTWLAKKYSVKSSLGGLQPYTDEGISSSIYDTMVITLYDGNMDLIGWAYGSGSQIIMR